MHTSFNKDWWVQWRLFLLPSVIKIWYWIEGPEIDEQRCCPSSSKKGTVSVIIVREVNKFTSGVAFLLSQNVNITFHLLVECKLKVKHHEHKLQILWLKLIIVAQYITLYIAPSSLFLQAKEAGSTRFCMGAAWRETIGRKTNFNQILEYVKEIRYSLGSFIFIQ